MNRTLLARRLEPFRDRGHIPRIPTRWQVFLGELQMWGWVISTDVTDEPRYAGAPLAHPWARQPLIFSIVGLDHLRIGTGLGARPISVVDHLHFTYHRGMPVWDLQVLQTHPRGLGLLEERTRVLLEQESQWSLSRMRRLRWVLPRPEDYLHQFLGPSGWIARAEAFDYGPTPSSDGVLPREFHSVVAFMEYCEASFPENPQHHGWRAPLDMMFHGTRRLRERGGFGWF